LLAQLRGVSDKGKGERTLPACYARILPGAQVSAAGCRFPISDFPSTTPNGCDYKDFMDWKKFFFAFITAFIFIFLFGWFFHEVVLKGTYAGVPSSLMRTPEEFKNHFAWLVLGQLVFVFVFVLIFAKGFAGGGVGAGISLGIMIAILGIGAHLITYAVQPFPGKLIACWSIGALVEMSILGAIVGAIYRPAALNPS
jgi:magnesium-transporting ATPase (P-type)